MEPSWIYKILMVALHFIWPSLVTVQILLLPIHLRWKRSVVACIHTKCFQCKWGYIYCKCVFHLGSGQHRRNWQGCPYCMFSGARRSWPVFAEYERKYSLTSMHPWSDHSCHKLFRKVRITQYGSTVYIGIAVVYPHWKPYVRILFIFTFNLKLISL